MDYASYVERMRAQARGVDFQVHATVREDGRELPLLRLTLPGARELVVTAGFHGEEPAGPLTLLEHLPEIVQAARARGVGLRIYPCINPSGFERGTRYNASGEKPNNDFLRYEVSPGTWKGELADGEAFLGHVIYPDSPKETRALCADLERHPAPAAALDLHQDAALLGSLTYAYYFGDRAPYARLMEEAGRHAEVARSVMVDEGIRSDEGGLIVFHDGSVTDYFWRRGVRWAAALETTTRTPMERCHAVNLGWVLGFIELAAAA